MLRCILFFTIIFAILLSVAASASDWPRFRGPSADGISSEKGINKDWSQKPPKKLWSVPMSDDGYAGPSVASGKVFIIDHKGQEDVVRAIDIKTGKDLWTYGYPDAEKASHGFTGSTPTVDGGRVFTFGRLGMLNCLNANTGKLIWSNNVAKEFDGKRPRWMYAMSILVDGNKVIACPGGPDATVVALDKTTGRTIWKGGGSRALGYATPITATILGKRQYVIFTATDLIGLDPATGAELWSCQWSEKSITSIAQPTVIGNSIFITTSYDWGCALVDITAEGAKMRWQNKEMKSHMSSPILLNDLVYGNSDPGEMVCMDPQTGTVKWKQSGFSKGPIAMVDGVFLVFDGKTGDLAMVEPSPEAYKELGRFKPLGGESWTAPIISNGKLIVRNKTELACFDLK